MKDINDTDNDSNSKQEFQDQRNTISTTTDISPDQQAGLLSRISGGVYNKAASVAGGVGWVAGTALSTTFSAVTTVGGIAISPFRKSPKCKSD